MENFITSCSQSHPSEVFIILVLQIQNRLLYKKIWRRFNEEGRKKDFISV